MLRDQSHHDDPAAAKHEELALQEGEHHLPQENIVQWCRDVQTIDIQQGTEALFDQIPRYRLDSHVQAKNEKADQ